MQIGKKKIGVIVNPSCGSLPNGFYTFLSTIKKEKIPQIQIETLSALRLAEEDLVSLQDASILLVIGGDGSLGYVVDTLIQRGDEDKIFGTLPAGTGNDTAKYLSTLRWNDLLKALEIESTVPLDVFSLKIETVEGTTMKGHFIVNLLLGHFGRALKDTPAFSKHIFGTFSYYIGILLAIFRYRNFYSSIRCNGQEVYAGENLAIFVGNLATACGGVTLAPMASPNDGKIDLLVAEDIKRLETLRALPQVLQGKHLTHPAVHYFRGKKIVMDLEYPHLGVDGEYLGKVKHLEVSYKTTMPFLSRREAKYHV